ncbi:MAG: hypothetical protein FJY73_02500 [Candidatus Eisenbacteria bacterium]|nr:hypothetical protein [Candidatus Eisenbacteria bacterium]
MRSRKRLVALVLVLALLVPYAALAGERPGAQVTNTRTDDSGVITGQQDIRGRTAMGGLLFWYQYFQMLRCFSRWGIAF